MFRKLSLTQQVVGMAALVTCWTLVVSVAAFVWHDTVNARERLMQDLVRRADDIGDRAAVPLDHGDFEALQRAVQALPREPQVSLAVLYDRTGAPVVRHEAPGTVGGPPPVPPTPTTRVDGAFVEVFRRVMLGTEPVGSVYLRAPAPSWPVALSRYLVPALTALVLSFATAVLLTSRVLRWILAPLGGLTRLARRVAVKQDYSIRAPKRTEDEIGALSDSLNQMLATIEQRDRQLSEERENLNKLVSMRTSELSLNNAVLRQEVLDRRQAEVGLSRTALELEWKNRELMEARDKALEAARLKSQFLANMSHEIRTPMNGVIGMTNILLRSDLTESQRRYVDTIRNCGQTLMTVINDILDFSKIEAGKLTMQVLDFNLRTAVEDVVRSFTEAASQKDLTLQCFFRAEVPTFVTGDPSRLRQILANLVSNAVKFTEEGSITVRVFLEDVVGGEPDHYLVRFEVADTGIGISPDGQARLFQSFSQVDGSPTREVGGTGLGLAISKQLAEMMGGRIGLESEPGEGSTFWFTTRLARQPDKRLQSRTLVNLRGLRVCVASPDASNREEIESYLRSWGMLAITDDGRTDTLTLLRRAAARGEPCDLVILDCAVLDQETLALARLIKNDPEARGVRLILLTAFGQRGDAQHAQEAGFSAYLTKPVRQSQLYDCIATIMQPAPDAAAQAEVRGGDRELDRLVTRHSLRNDQGGPFGHVLLAEDNPVNQSVALLTLEEYGFVVDVAGNGREAVEAAKHTPYDMILMDCQMPELDGFAATRAIREAESRGEIVGRSGRRLPIIALTAHAIQGDREACLKAGMDDYLAKPFGPEEVEAVLGRWLGGLPQRPPLPASPATVPTPAGPPDRPPPGGDLQPVIDRKAWERIQALQRPDRPDVLGRLLTTYLKDSQAQMERLHRALEAQDAHEVNRLAHSLKSSSANVGATRLSALCKELEGLGKSGALEEAARVLVQAETEYTVVFDVLTDEVGRRSPDSTLESPTMS